MQWIRTLCFCGLLLVAFFIVAIEQERNAVLKQAETVHKKILQRLQHSMVSSRFSKSGPSQISSVLGSNLWRVQVLIHRDEAIVNVCEDDIQLAVTVQVTQRNAYRVRTGPEQRRRRQ